MASERKNQFSSTTLQTISMVVGKISALLATFAIPLILTRLLSKSEYGVFAQFYVVVAFCVDFFSLSFHSNLYYFYPTSDTKYRKSLVFQTLLFLFISTLIASLFIITPEIGARLIGEGELLNYKKYIILGIILLLPVIIIEPLYVVRKDNITSAVYPPSEVLLRLSLVITFVLIQPGLSSVFSGIILSAAICLIFVLTYAAREIGFGNFGKGLLNKELIVNQLKYSIPFGLAVSLNILLQRFDKIVCISFLSPSQFAAYAVSFYGIPGVLQVYNSLSQVYLIQMSLKYKENNISELLEIYKSLVVKTYSFSIPAIFIVYLYSNKLISFLFTSNYIDAVPLFRTYLLSILVFMLGSGLILRASGKTKYTLRSYIISSIVVIPLTYFMIRYIGIWGAMTGALISITMPRILNLAVEIKILNSNLRSFFPWRKFGYIFLISALSVIPFVIMEQFLHYGILLTAVFGCTYLVIVSLVEIRYNLFVFDSVTIKSKIETGLDKVRGFLYRK
jgi:O-antigen/teichoic acid export membrane protein